MLVFLKKLYFALNYGQLCVLVWESVPRGVVIEEIKVC